MTHCTRCGAPLGATARFCAACGAIVEVGSAAPRMSPPSAPAAPPALAGGPPGRVQDPVLVPVLVLVTLGIYYFFWSWRIAKETDAFAATPGRALTPVKIGVIVTGVAIAIMLPAYVMMFAGFVEGLPPAVADGSRELTPEEAAILAESVAPWVGLVLLALIASLAGYVALLVGHWRVWRVIEADERARGAPSPLSPALMLVFIAVPYLNLVAMWYAFYRVQKGLNGVWQAPGRGPAW
ncbi:MAG TPA: zinc ribbon domain-containing protein [Candidatus Thermoplasmatota archaeon]|nr:zinc ribbon domain-containing protein [Candidatus Thermoplasmatota archaeon]